MSEDGSAVYFVAMAVLDTDPNDAGASAQPEAPNLYRWQEGSGVRYVATLSENDSPDWGKPFWSQFLGKTSASSAYSSPSGRYLTFMSELNLAGDESADPESGEPVEEVFLYDSQTERLSCVSCNPSGATDAGRVAGADKSERGLVFPDLQNLWQERLVGATLPPKTESESTIGYTFYQPRAVLDNGRVFFNSAAPLVYADSNGTWDAYQYEPLGVGSCSASSGGASIARSGEGCIALISPGTDDNPSVFLDASESGEDLFFLTAAQLSVLDSDTNFDVYDARVDGVAAVAPQNPECLGEACQPAAKSPNDATPASAAFKGAGNVKSSPAKRCGKAQRKVRRKGKVRCVKRKRQARAKRRASR